MFDTSEIVALSVALGKVPGEATRAVMAAVTESGEDFRKEWESAAQRRYDHPGGSARHYHKSITASPGASLFAISVEVGPEKGRGRGRQGSLGPVLEYGTATKPPHLDGHRSAAKVMPLADKRIGDAAHDAIERLL